MWTKLFWLGALERAIKTFAQAAVAVLAANSVGLLDAPWGAAASAAGMAAVLSLLTSIGSATIGDRDSPSLVRTAAAPAGSATLTSTPQASPTVPPGPMP
ncbi:holin [Allokutzneria sp. NRRL B-24872]|uniref:holin n=1 Tax=Allokutzneria sp. NRRL B-24872 TaxID=1137961 RepID=UPI000A3A2767|nr:holin [Allokutzneria sp. NRRL B-24872]